MNLPLRRALLAVALGLLSCTRATEEEVTPEPTPTPDNAPVIESVSKANPLPGDTFTVTGRNFSPVRTQNVVWTSLHPSFSNVTVIEVLSATTTLMRLRAPRGYYSAGPNLLRVEYNRLRSNVFRGLTFVAEIDSVQIRRDDATNVIVYGRGLSRDIDVNAYATLSSNDTTDVGFIQGSDGGDKQTRYFLFFSHSFCNSSGPLRLRFFANQVVVRGEGQPVHIRPRFLRLDSTRVLGTPPQRIIRLWVLGLRWWPEDRNIIELIQPTTGLVQYSFPASRFLPVFHGQQNVGIEADVPAGVPAGSYLVRFRVLCDSSRTLGPIAF